MAPEPPDHGAGSTAPQRVSKTGEPGVRGQGQGFQAGTAFPCPQVLSRRSSTHLPQRAQAYEEEAQLHHPVVG